MPILVLIFTFLIRVLIYAIKELVLKKEHELMSPGDNN